MTVEAQGASKDFIRDSGKGSNRFTAVSGADLRIEPGKLTLLMGRSGSGKSTLLNMLSGLLTPTAGKILYDSEDIYSWDDERLSRFRSEHTGVIPQGQTAIHSLSVIDNVCLSYMLYGGGQSEAYPRARELMERLGIAQLENAYPPELSGGELRRMAIARALLRGPEVVFADEPTCDLDDENTRLVLDILKETAAAGAAVFAVTHEKDAADYADIVYNMNAGKISQQ